MRTTILLSTSLAAMLVALLPAVPAQAQFFKTFVSSEGNDVNDCSFATPCRNFQRAHDQTVIEGQIACLDSGIFDRATITKTITIDCAGTSANTPGFIVNGADSVVTIRNLTLNQNLIGIDFQNGAALFVENCIIRDITAGSALAIRFRPSAPGSQLVVSDTVIRHNGTRPSTGGGIQVAPAAGGSAGVVLNRVQFGFNVTAMALDSTNGTIGAVMRDSVVTASRSNGILSLAGANPINFTIERSSLDNNVGVAIQSQGANSFVGISDSTIVNNQAGVSAVGGGVVQSFKNNTIARNGSDGTPLTAFPGPGGTPLQ